jgi:hypothetical protein
MKHASPSQLLYTPPMLTINIPHVAHPQQECAWCWYTVHNESFPETVSSTICSGHMAWMEQRYYNLMFEKKKG